MTILCAKTTSLRDNRPMSDKKELTVVDQREVEFYGDELLAIRADDSRVYVSITNMCDSLGLDAQGQRRRIERHLVYLILKSIQKQVCC